MLIRLVATAVARYAFAIVALIAPTDASAQLTLSISTDKTTYMPGEPIIAHVVIANGKGEVQLPAVLAPEYGALKYFIAFNKGEPREFRPWSRFDNERLQTLGPQQAIQVQGKVFFGANGWTFKEEGSYSIQVELLGVRSPPAQVRVDPSKVEAERLQSGQLTNNNDAGLFLLFEGGDHLKSGIAVVEEIAKTNTVLAGYANYALGMQRSKEFNDFTNGTRREPNWIEAESFFRRGMVLIPKDAVYFNLKNHSQFGDTLLRNGKKAEANKVRLQLSSFIANDVLKRDLPAGVKGFAQTVKQ